MDNFDKSFDKWLFLLKKSDNSFFYENDEFSLDLLYSYCSDIYSQEHTCSQPMHKHQHYEMHMVLTGGFCYETDDKNEYEVKQGEFVIFAPGVNHRITSETPRFSKLAITFHLTPKETKKALFYRVAKRKISKPQVLSYNQQMYDIFKMTLDLSAQKPHEYRSSFFFLMISFIIEMMRVVIGDEKLDNSSSYKDDRIGTAIDFIKLNISANLKVSDVSKHLHMSTRQFTKIFTEETGVSPGNYIKDVRVKHITDLLVNSDLYITDIVNVMCYPDSAALIKAFKRSTGITPARYRKLYKRI